MDCGLNELLLPDGLKLPQWSVHGPLPIVGQLQILKLSLIKLRHMLRLPFFHRETVTILHCLLSIRRLLEYPLYGVLRKFKEVISDLL